MDLPANINFEYFENLVKEFNSLRQQITETQDHQESLVLVSKMAGILGFLSTESALLMQDLIISTFGESVLSGLANISLKPEVAKTSSKKNIDQEISSYLKTLSNKTKGEN